MPVKAVILPVPLAPNPIDVLLFVQLYVTPATGLLNNTGAVSVPLHTVWLAGWSTVGVGATITVAVVVGPGQPLAVGVIVNVTVTGAFVVLVNIPVIGVPEPLAAIPVTVALLSLVQANVAPATPLVNTIGVIAVALQIVCAFGVAIAFGVGLTNTVAVLVGPGQPLAVGVIVNVTVIGAAVILVSVPLILLTPLPGNPVTPAVLFLIHVKVVPATPLVNTIGVIVAPEQIVWLAGVAIAFGVGLTVIEAVVITAGQPPEAAIE